MLPLSLFMALPDNCSMFVIVNDPSLHAIQPLDIADACDNFLQIVAVVHSDKNLCEVRVWI